MAALMMVLDALIGMAALASAAFWWSASRQRLRRISRHEVLDPADINRIVTVLNRTQILNARAALATAGAGLLAAVRIGLSLFGAV
jgi:hypothetical protein